jgi:Kdo2-lipid IVA lauroyltransferase/acyltransferase
MSTVRPTLGHRIQHTLFTGALAATNVLSDGAAVRFGAAVGRLGYRPIGLRRKVAEQQIAAAFPERDAAWVRSVARASFEHLGRETIALLRMSRMTPEVLLARTEVEGIERGDAAYREGRGVVIVAGHFGNWEIGASMIAVRGYRIDAIVQRQRNPLFDAWIVGARERLGVGVIERSQAPRQALRSLRAGHAVAFVADQNAGRSGVFVPFFGRLASTHRGPALMALRTGAPMFLAVPRRVGDNRYRMRLEEIVADRGGDQEAAVERITAAFTARLEAAIRAAPEQYMWQHRRWKTRPPEELPNAVEV